MKLRLLCSLVVFTIGAFAPAAVAAPGACALDGNASLRVSGTSWYLTGNCADGTHLLGIGTVGGPGGCAGGRGQIQIGGSLRHTQFLWGRGGILVGDQAYSVIYWGAAAYPAGVPADPLTEVHGMTQSMRVLPTTCDGDQPLVGLLSFAS
ncbi:MAG: hypothetical protein ACRDJM_03600 [Actinomycetota bacterium]